MLPFLFLVTAIMISFTPATAVIGVATAFIAYLIMKRKTKKRAPDLHAELASVVGILVGAGIGLLSYGPTQYVKQWHSLWWIPGLWFLGSLIGLIIALKGGNQGETEKMGIPH